MDNATAEYTYVTTFFATEPLPSPQHHITRESSSGSGMLSPTSLLSPTQADFDDIRSNAGSDFGASSPRRRLVSLQSTNGSPPQGPSPRKEQVALASLWKQILDPVLEYCKVCLSESSSFSSVDYGATDFCHVCPGANASCHPTAYHDSSHRRYHG